MKTFTLKRSGTGQNTDMGLLMKAERTNLLRYACYRLGDPDDAEDAVQDIFIRLHARQQEAEGKPLSNLRSYLYRSLSNICTDRLRRRHTRVLVPIEQAAQVCEEPTENFEQEFQMISRLLSCIPEEQAEVIRLRLHGGNSFADIADILNIPVSTAKSRFQYGIDKIRNQIKRQ